MVHAMKPATSAAAAIVMAALHVALPLAALAWSLEISRRSVAFAFFLNWALMGFAFVVWMFLPIRLTPGYYRIHGFEQEGRLYERFGIRVFQHIVRATKIHGPAPFPRYTAGPGGAAALAADTYNSETGHLVIFAIVCGVAVDAIRRGWWDTAGWLILFDILLNAYPVMSMRHVRARASRLKRYRGSAATGRTDS